MPGPRSKALIKQLRETECAEVTFFSESFPVVWQRGQGCLIQDADRNWYLDFAASFGALPLGHCWPAIVRTIRRQAGKLVHGMGDVHPSQAKIAAARELLKRLPLEDGRVIFASTGAEAVEIALKTALLATGRKGLLAFEGAYHGMTLGALRATWRKEFREPFVESPARFATYGEVDEVERALATGDYGAVLFEPIQGRGGIRVPPTGWDKQLRALCDRHGALLIADEVFCGMGRTGRWFDCDCAHIYCVGKALGGGLPLSACVGGVETMAAWGESTGEARHTSTFLGHPLACTVALTVFNELERLRLLERASTLGDAMRKELESMPGAKAVRGKGLMIGVEIEGGAERGWKVVVDCLQKGLILIQAGAGDVIEITPPLILQDSQAEAGLAILRQALAVST